MPTTKRTKRIQMPWLLVGPEPHMAHCQRCGGVEAKPPMPCSFRVLKAHMADIKDRHRRCQPPEAEGGE